MTYSPLISVVICTYNPRSDYLSQVLQSLYSQTLAKEAWELLLIDNASEKILSTEIDISWHPQSRHIREEKLGLTPARLKGIKESIAEILIFVDDDNVLAPDYLEVALQISKDYSLLGAWGGQVRPEFEVQPPEWTKPYWGMLAIREFDRDKWSNLPNQHETTPCGAGLCIRKFVAEKYALLVSTQTERAELDRKGKQLISCGDSDMAWTSCDLGLGTGQFISLKMNHLIPASRIEQDYLERLSEGMGYSLTIVNSFRGQLPTKASWRAKIFQSYLRWRLLPDERRLYDAGRRGIDRALKELNCRSLAGS